MKAVFFDADGTICDIKNGVPHNTYRAIRQLMANGHQAFLCTGRCRALVTNDLEEIGFDGIIAACGTYMEYQNKVLLNEEVPPEIAYQSVQILRKHGLIPVLEGTEYMYYELDEYTENIDWFSSMITQKLGKKRLSIQGNEKRLHINKISAKAVSGSNPDGACLELANIYTPIRHSEGFVNGTIELVPHGYSKGLAVLILSAALGIPQEDIVIFGDSNNDLSMFETNVYRVAMGNAPQNIKALSDYVTTPLEQDGIELALRHLKLI